MARRRNGARAVAVAVLAMTIVGCSPAPSITPSPGSSSASAPVAPTTALATASMSPSSASPTAPAVSTPSSLPAPAPSPSPSAAAGWPFRTTTAVQDVLFLDDGRVAVNAIDTASQSLSVAMLLPDGSMAAGWPWQPSPDEASLADVVPGPAGSLYVLGRAGPLSSPDDWKETLHRLAADGTEMAGFPVTMPAVSYCALMASPSGSAVVACQQDATTTVSSPATTVALVRPDGTSPAGWPVRVADGATPVGFLHDGGLVLRVDTNTAMRVAVLDASGRLAAGWQRPAFGGISDVSVDPAGRVRVVSRDFQDGECGAPIRTTYAVLGSNGRPAAGWPVSISGWGSGPVIRSDGSMVIATSGGRVLAYSLDGRRLAGWTSSVPVAAGCFGGSTPVSAGTDGQLVLSYQRATLVTSGGRIAGGWPTSVPGTVAIDCPTCTPGPAAPIPPVVGRTGIYVAAYGPRTTDGASGAPRVAVFRRGGGLPASQQVIGASGNEVAWLRMAPDGRVFALLTHDDGATAGSTLVLVARDRPVGS